MCEKRQPERKQGFRVYFRSYSTSISRGLSSMVINLFGSMAPFNRYRPILNNLYIIFLISMSAFFFVRILIFGNKESVQKTMYEIYKNIYINQFFYCFDNNF